MERWQPLEAVYIASAVMWRPLYMHEAVATDVACNR